MSSTSDAHTPEPPASGRLSRRTLVTGAFAAVTGLSGTACSKGRNPFKESTVEQMAAEPILARRPGETELVSKRVEKGSQQLGVRNAGPAVERVFATTTDIDTVVNELYQSYAARYNLKRADLTRTGQQKPVVVELQGSSEPDRTVLVVASTEPFVPTVANRDELGRIPADARTIVDIAVVLREPKKKTER